MPIPKTINNPLLRAVKDLEDLFDDTFASKIARLESAATAVSNLIPVDDRRLPLLVALAQMPEEAFGWLVLACQPPQPQRTGSQVWPDGIGGFQDDSRAAINAVRSAAKAYIDDVIREPPK